MRIKILSLALIIMMLFLFIPAAQAQSLSSYTKANGYTYIQLGSYPQQIDGTVQPIVWRVLEATEDEAFLLSEYVLFNHRVHEDYLEYEGFEGQFNKTDIFVILNETFLQTAFTDKEQILLLNSEDLGKVFLITSADLQNKAYGFFTNRDRQAFGTAYAIENGLFKYSNSKTGRGSSPFWTRTRSTTLASGVRCTKVDGSVGYIRCVVMNEGIRPAVKIKLNHGEIEVLSGTGTLDSPFVLKRD